MKTVAVLAVQGAFIEHERMLAKLGCACIELRQAADLQKPFDALVLPGGESTAQAKMLRELGMLDTLRSRIKSGMPVLGTCAGLILLAENVEEGMPAAGDPNGPVAAGATAPGAIGTLPITVRRNAYGRQLGSFRTFAPCKGLADAKAASALPVAGTTPDRANAQANNKPKAKPANIESSNPAGIVNSDAPQRAIDIPMTFIRAPFIKEVHGDTQILAQVDSRIVAVRNDNQIGVAFHPELDTNPAIHRLLVSLI